MPDPIDPVDVQATLPAEDIPSVPASPAARTARFLNRTFPQSYAALSALPRTALAYRWLRRLEAAGLGQRLSKLPFQQVRTSDTVFVLGTGASINDYPQQWWRHVQKHDSIGMNFFLLHEHIPTLHVMENLDGIRSLLLNTRYNERGDYRGVPLVLKTQLTNLSHKRVAARIADLRALHDSVLAQTYLSMDLLAAGRTVSDMESAYRTLRRLGLWRPKERFVMLTKRRGSITYVINLAVRAGYRRIVLCGIDLNHTEFFYDSRRPQLESEGLPVPINDEFGSVHSTNDPTTNPVTVREVILGINRTVLQPMGVQLMVGSESSALYPEVPRFGWEHATGGGSGARPRPV